jgi:hypothetical protein
MDTQVAYTMICLAVEQHPQRCLLSRSFDEQHFGNFFVSFTQDGEVRSVVNDKGFLYVTGDLEGKGEALATVPSLYETEPHSLLMKLCL